MAGYRVLDIETVVDRRYWDPPASKWFERPVDSFGSASMGSSKGGATVRSEGRLWEEQESFPPPQAHRVVAMSWVDLSGDDDKWYSFESATSLCDWSYDEREADAVEKAMLATFGERQSADEATIVTWNGRTFDLPVVNLRSFLHRIPCEWYYKERDLRYRYTEACHCDLMDVFSDYGAARSMKLGDVARLAGLPGKIGEVSGGGIKDIYDGRGKPFASLDEAKAAVGAYCLLDAMQTAALFAMSRVHKGMISQEYFASVVAPSFNAELARAVAAVEGRKAA